MKIKIEVTNIEKIKCTNFENMKVCVFIFVTFKNAIDWKIIERPLKDKIPEVKISEDFPGLIERVATPLVTSKIPYINPSWHVGESLNIEKIGLNNLSSRSNTSNFLSSSAIKKKIVM